jgi:type II secretory pathway component PulM
MWYAVNNQLECAVDEVANAIRDIREAAKRVAAGKSTAAMMVTESLRFQLLHAEQLDKNLRAVLLAIQPELTIEKEASA